MKEVMDPSTGAILFKSEPEDPIEKKIILLTNQVKSLENRVKELEGLLRKS